MNGRQDGGSIFPAVGGEHEFYPGLTIWDFYAGQALAGMCSRFAMSYHSAVDAAEASAKIADAMMADRERRGIN